MGITGIGPYIKRNGSFRIMLQGTGYVQHMNVTLSIKVNGVTTTRHGEVIQIVNGGCIAKIDNNVRTDEEEVYDEDLAEITVTVTNLPNPNTVTEPGIQE